MNSTLKALCFTFLVKQCEQQHQKNTSELLAPDPPKFKINAKLTQCVVATEVLNYTDYLFSRY